MSFTMMPPFTRQLQQLPTWLFPGSVYNTIGFFIVIEENEDGMPWRCDIPMARGTIRMVFWKGEWNIAEGCEYRQDLIDAFADFMIRYHQ